MIKINTYMQNSLDIMYNTIYTLKNRTGSFSDFMNEFAKQTCSLLITLIYQCFSPTSLNGGS